MVYMVDMVGMVNHKTSRPALLLTSRVAHEICTRAGDNVEVVGPAARGGGRRRVPDVEALRRRAELPREGPLHAVDVHADGLFVVHGLFVGRQRWVTRVESIAKNKVFEHTCGAPEDLNETMKRSLPPVLYEGEGGVVRFVIQGVAVRRQKSLYLVEWR